MTIEHAGVRYTPSNEEVRAIEREGRHPSRRLMVVRACERCAVLCVLGASTCSCCAKHGTRNPGGGVIHYPDDSRGHVDVMSIDEFSDLAVRAGIAA